jgi:hypothetical protein
MIVKFTYVVKETAENSTVLNETVEVLNSIANLIDEDTRAVIEFDEKLNNMTGNTAGIFLNVATDGSYGTIKEMLKSSASNSNLISPNISLTLVLYACSIFSAHFLT